MGKCSVFRSIERKQAGQADTGDGNLNSTGIFYSVLFILFYCVFPLQLQILIIGLLFKSQPINSMTTSFFLPLHCLKPQNLANIQLNPTSTSNILLPCISAQPKFVYSLKENKYVERETKPKTSLKSVRRSVKTLGEDKENAGTWKNPKNKGKTLQISFEVGVSYIPEIIKYTKDFDGEYERGLSRDPSRVNSMIGSHELMSQRETQLCGAQERIMMKKQISNQSTQCRVFDQKNTHSIMLIDSAQEKVLRTGKSEGNLFELTAKRLRPYGSVIMRQDMGFAKVPHEDPDKSPSLVDLNLFKRDSLYEPNSQNCRNSSTYAMNNSITGSIRSKMGQKLRDMSIRSTKSIKEEESVDEFSEVLKSSKASEKKKISLSSLMGSKTVRRVVYEREE